MDEGWVGVYRNIPVVTRVYTTATILLTLATNWELITQYQIYLNPTLILDRHQYWRLLTCFLYAGPFTFGTTFNLLFMYRYSRILEEASFRRSSADFCFMFIFIWLALLGIAWGFSEILFLSGTFTHAILYIWCRRNPMQHVIIFGLLVVRADLVPLVLVGLSLMTGSQMESDLMAFGAGHLYYYLNDVFPRQPRGFRILRTPHFLKFLFNEEEEAEASEQEQIGVDGNNMVNAGIPAAPPAAPAPMGDDVNVNVNPFPLN